MDDANVVEIAPYIKPSRKGEYDFIDFTRIYRQQGRLNLEVMGRSMAWLDIVTHNSLLEAVQFVITLGKHQGLKVSCSEEIARRSYWLTDAQLEGHTHQLGKSGCGEYVKSLLAETMITRSRR